jgi:hypothetical protein
MGRVTGVIDWDLIETRGYALNDVIFGVWVRIELVLIREPRDWCIYI